jgi:hypothetical protein
MSEPTQPLADAPAPEPIAPTPEPSSPPPPVSDAPITAREAATLISGQPDQASADKADAAPRKESRGETEAQEPPEESLKPPRSWPKAEQEAFAALTREHQEAFLARDRAREADIQLGLRQAAEQRRAAEALAQQAEQAQAQARAAYERSLPQEVLLLEAKYREEFGTPTEAEIAEWESTDPTRWIRWNGAFQRVTRARWELQQQQSQQAQQQYQQQQQFMQNAEAWKAQETEKFLEKAPEWKDQATYGKKVAAIMNYLEKDIGFEREFLERAANEFLPIQIHDHKFQLMAWKSHLYDEAQKAARSPSRATVPPVQRPGSAPNKGEAQEARFKDLNRQLDRSGNARDAARLIAAMNGR